MFDTIFGLPVHPVAVHATVIIVPAAALAVGLAALWSRFRAWAGWLPFGLSLAALALVPLSVRSGEALRDRVGGSPLVGRHSELGEGLLPWAIALTVAATGGFWMRRRAHGDTGGPTGFARALVVAVTLLAVVSATGTLVQVVRIGHSGAEAAWSDVVGEPGDGRVR